MIYPTEKTQDPIVVVRKRKIHSGPWGVACAVTLFFCSVSQAMPAKNEEKSGWYLPREEERVVLENDDAKVVIWPFAGGAMTEYINKKTGTNFVAGEVEAGKSRFGWKDTSKISPQDPDTERFSSLPHEVRKFDTPDGSGVELRCRSRGVESSREILLDGPRLRVTVRQRNLSEDPRRLYPRWHPYMMIGDPYAESSVMFFPSEAGNIRKLKTGMGWDSHFLEPGGFAIAANWKTGEGLWMTYEAEKVPYVATWTDYQRNKPHPLRGAFTIEPQLPPLLKGPGEGVELICEYFPFTAETPAVDFPMEVIGSEKETREARRFLELVRPNLEVIGTHTMVPTPPNSALEAICQNRFSYLHVRRDRMALRDWGIADALFSMPGKQDIAARIRFYGKLFPTRKTPVELDYVFFVQDGFGRRVINERRPVVLTPEAPHVDQRVDVDLSKLPDGRYEAGVEVFEKGGEKPIHRVVESRNLVGQRRNELASSRVSGLVERPFVTALRQVEYSNESHADLSIPIGIEDASGVSRTDWPMTVGVPFSRGMVKPGSPLKLLDPKNNEIGFDSRIAGTWDDGSIKWLLIDFNGTVPADGHVFYHLKSGPSQVEAAPLLLNTKGDTVVFDNGLRQWSWKDSSEAGELGPVRGEGLWWTNAEGKRFRFRMEGEGAGLRIERNGAYRAVVRATGWYYAEGVEKPVARGILRFEGYRGQPQLKIEHNVMFAGDAWHERLASFGLTLPLTAEATGDVEIGVDGATVKVPPTFTLSQLQDTACVIQAGGKESLASQASGVFAFPQKTGMRTVVFSNFWRLNPKEVRMKNPSAVEFFYWPEKGAPLGFLPREDGWISSSSSPEAIAVGAGRTHELYLIDGPARNLEETDRLFDEPVLAIVPPRYLAATGAMMHLQPYDPDRSPELEKIISEVFDSYLLNQKLWGWNGAWTYGAMPNTFLPEEYRWADFGRYAHILNEMDIVQTAWLAYMRSGDRKYLKFAEANTRQLMEVSTIHWNDTWPEYVGLSRRHHESVWLSGGDYGHTMLDPFLEMYRVTGHEPAWEAAVAAAEAMKKQRSGAWRYISNPLAGLSRMYLETQDPSYREHADRIWKDLCFPDQNDWWLDSHGCRAVLYYSQLNPECKKIWKAWALRLPRRFIGMDALSALYLETKNPNYADAVARAFKASYPVKSHEAVKTDPLRWHIGDYTQHILNDIREMCYAGSTLEAAGARSGALENAADLEVPKATR